MITIALGLLFFDYEPCRILAVSFLVGAEAIFYVQLRIVHSRLQYAALAAITAIVIIWLCLVKQAMP